MTIKEMSSEIRTWCNERVGCEGCPLRAKIEGIRNGTENCSYIDEYHACDIERNYNILVETGCIKSPINFTKVNPEEVTRKAILETATKYVCSDRNDQYGSPEDSFKAIAELWSAYLGKPITAKDVAAMMVLFKMARVKTGTAKADNWIDAAGYCACGGECEAKEIEK